MNRTEVIIKIDELLRFSDFLSETDLELVKKIDSNVASCQHRNLTTYQFDVIMNIYEKFTKTEKFQKYIEKTTIDKSSKLETKETAFSGKNGGIFIGFTNNEIWTLKRYLKFYKSLDEGTRVPTTPAQRHFVRVCQGLETPETDHELLYLSFGDNKRSLIRLIDIHTKELEHNKPHIEEVHVSNQNKATRPTNIMHHNQINSKKSVPITKHQNELQRISLGRMNLRMRKIVNAMAVGSD